MNLNTIPGIVKAIVELRRDVDAIMKEFKSISPIDVQEPFVDEQPRRGRHRKIDIPVVVENTVPPADEPKEV